MTIGRKLGLGFAMLLLLFVVSGVTVDWVVRDVSGRLTHLRAVDEPTSEAAYGMEINAIGSGLSVLKYVETQNPAYKGQARKAQGEFERNKAVYDERAESAEARDAGRRLGDLHGEYRALGDGLMDAKDEREELLVRINGDFRRMDGLLDEKMQPDLDRQGAQAADKAEVVSEMETNIAETGSAFGAYLREPVGTNRAAISDHADDFATELRELRGLGLEGREEYWLGELQGQFDETEGRIDESLALEEKLQTDTERFSSIREQIDGVLDQEVQATSRRSLEDGEAAAAETVGDVRGALLALLLVGLLMGIAAAVVISRNIGAPVRRLVEGAQKIGAGTLEHRIRVESRDEIGELARAFNEMAENRQRSEGEVRRLNSELEARVAERTAELTRAASELGESEERYRAVVEQTAECLFIFDAETKRILETNAAFRELFGYGVEELKEMRIYDIVADDPASVDANVRQNREHGHHRPGERRYRRRDGSVVDVEVTGNVISYGDRGEVVCGIARDITERKRAEEELRGAEARYRALVDGVPAALYTANFEDPPALTYVSPRYEELTGYALEDHLSDPVLWSRMLHPEDREWVLAENRQVNISGDPFEVEYRLMRRDGRVVWVQDASYVLKNEGGLPLYRQGFLLDVTERKELQEQLSHQAFHDGLTGLPNRALFMNRLAHGLTSTERDGETVAVLLLDLDRFKNVNDSLGHDAGDELLMEVARRLKDCLRPGDTAARIGGDEFCVLLEDIAGESEAIRVVERLREALSTPILVDGQEVHVSTSVGIALSSGAAYRQGKGADALLRDADLAMYEAKARGKNKHVVYDPSMNARARARLKKENDLRRAIEHDELAVYYQPKVDLRTGGISGFEALVRWESPERGIVPPGEFIDLAEETDLIFPLCRWVLEEACSQAKEWREEYGSYEHPLSVSVNVSARQLQPEHGGIVEEVERVLRTTGLDPESLHLEITESVLMEDVPQNISMLARLRALGVRIEIDDFGTGYSSLSYLKNFPVDVLKIDRSFVDKLDADEESAAIVEAMISLAHTLDLEVVAEGVETPAQLARLRSLGCDLGQGYHFGRPVVRTAAAEILETVSARR